MRAVVRCLLLIGFATGCSGTGLLGDGTSISVGTFHHGLLRRGHPLPVRGEGYRVPPLWATRGNNYGTDELVEAIQRAARRVRREYPGNILGVGDLSPRGGGTSLFHRSHENGRDVDLIWFAVDEQSRPVAPADSMPRYDATELRAHPPRADARVRFSPFSPRRFDLKRNWALIRALLEDPYVEIQYLFCHQGLKQRLLDYALSIGEDPALLERADAILRQPGDSLPHDDHLHVRIFCSAEDRPYGCVDHGPVRWWKKRYKYLPPARPGNFLEAIARLSVSPFPGLHHFIP